MERVDAVAHANENMPVNAIAEGIKRHSTGRMTVKFPTDVKKLAVNIIAVIQSPTKLNRSNAAAQIVSDKN